MNILAYILPLPLILHICTAAYMIYRISKTDLFTKKQKIINGILVVALPFIWTVLIYFIFKKEPSSYEIKVKNDVSSNGFHESSIGIDPGTHLPML